MEHNAQVDTSTEGVRDLAVCERDTDTRGAVAVAQRVSEEGSNRHGLVGTLATEGAAAQALFHNMRAIISDDDEDLIGDTVEGETNLMETIDRAIVRLQEIEAHGASIKSQMTDLKERSDRFKKQSELIRTALASALGMARLKKVERALATISLRAVAPSLVVVEEADIPSEYFEPQPPRLDKKAVLDALKSGEKVPGASLSSGGETISIRSK